jgi:hypothetical protein
MWTAYWCLLYTEYNSVFIGSVGVGKKVYREKIRVCLCCTKSCTVLRKTFAWAAEFVYLEAHSPQV